MSDSLRDRLIQVVPDPVDVDDALAVVAEWLREEAEAFAAKWLRQIREPDTSDWDKGYVAGLKRAAHDVANSIDRPAADGVVEHDRVRVLFDKLLALMPEEFGDEVSLPELPANGAQPEPITSEQLVYLWVRHLLEASAHTAIRSGENTDE